MARWRQRACGKGRKPPAKTRASRVALLDYGAKHNIVRELNRRGCHVSILPHDTAAEDVLSGGYDGVMLSNGPGDPRRERL